MKMPSFMASVIRAGGARSVALASSLIFTALASKIIFQVYGSATFGIVTFIASLQYLIPFADLGLGAVIMNSVAIARRDGDISRAHPMIFRSLKAQLTFAFLIAVAILAAALQLGPELDFAAGKIPTSALLAAALIIILNIPMSFGNRVLIGLDSTHTSIYILALAPPLVLSVVALFSAMRVDAIYLYSVWPLAALISSVAVTVIAMKRIQLRTGQLARGILRTQMKNRSEPIWGTAISMFFISISSPLTHNSHRLILGITAVPHGLATYALGAQIFSPLLSLITSSATPLWTQFAAAKGSRRGFLVATGLFGLIGVLASGLLFIATPMYAWFVSGDAYFVPWQVTAAFAAFLIANSLALPSMMRLNSGRDIKFQALVTSIACLVGLPFAFWAAATWGTQGPIVASAITMTAIQLVPMLLWQLLRRNSPAAKEQERVQAASQDA